MKPKLAQLPFGFKRNQWFAISISMPLSFCPCRPPMMGIDQHRGEKSSYNRGEYSDTLLGVHAIAITPAGSMELVRSSLSIDCGLPCEKVRSAPAIVFSRPAQRLLTLWPARSPSRHATLYIESSRSLVASAAASIATGWSEPVPGREFHPLKSSAFHGALFRQLRSSTGRTVLTPIFAAV